MSQATLAWAAFKNMLRAAGRDPLWAFVALISLPFRIWQGLLKALFILIVALFVIGFGGRSSSNNRASAPARFPSSRSISSRCWCWPPWSSVSSPIR